MQRILVYSHDTYGLGNIRRMLALVETLARRVPDACILIVSGSPMLQSFRLSPGIDYVKLPCLERSERGAYGSRFLAMPHEVIVRMRARLIRESVENFDPHLILVDKKPLGVENELAPMFDRLGRTGRRPRVALVLREILDAPVVTRAIWSRKGYQKLVETLYDSVLVLGPKRVFDTAREYGFRPSLSARVRHCGYVHKGERTRPQSSVRAELDVAHGKRLIVLTTGGGKDGEVVLQTALDALLPRAESDRLHVLLVCGPELDDASAAALERRCDAHPAANFVRFTDDLASYLEAADLVVSMAGYNTVTELLGMGKRGVLVPRIVPSVEQLMRAQRLAALGLFAMVHPDDLDAPTLFEAIMRTLSSEPPTARTLGIDMHALDNVLAAVKGLLAEPQARPSLAREVMRQILVPRRSANGGVECVEAAPLTAESIG